MNLTCYQSKRGKNVWKAEREYGKTRKELQYEGDDDDYDETPLNNNASWKTVRDRRETCVRTWLNFIAWIEMVADMYIQMHLSQYFFQLTLTATGCVCLSFFVVRAVGES